MIVFYSNFFNILHVISDFFNTASIHINVVDVNDNPPSPVDDDSLQLILCEDSDKKKQVFVGMQL